MEAADALADWRTWVAQGRASVRNGVLCITLPEMTEAQWTAEHVTAH